MVDGLHCLRHDGIVGRNYDYTQVGDLCATGTHGGERLMARGVEEGDMPSVGQFHVVSPDVLGDASGLARNHIGLAYIVEQ